jgi:hypothetical protein
LFPLLFDGFIIARDYYVVLIEELVPGEGLHGDGDENIEIGG